MISCLSSTFVQDMAPNKLSMIASYDYKLSFYTSPNPKLTVRQLFLSLIIPLHSNLTEFKIHTKN